MYVSNSLAITQEVNALLYVQLPCNSSFLTFWSHAPNPSPNPYGSMIETLLVDSTHFYNCINQSEKMTTTKIFLVCIRFDTPKVRTNEVGAVFYLPSLSRTVFYVLRNKILMSHFDIQCIGLFYDSQIFRHKPDFLLIREQQEI